MITLSPGAAFAIALASLLSPPAGLAVEDIFGRSLNDHGLVLVDWEGYIANPAIKVFLVPPPDARYPARVVVTAREPRLYFDMPSTAGPGGPRKVITLPGPEKTSLSVSILPDRDAQDEDYALDVEFTDADGVRRTLALPVHVVDQDRDRRPDFSVTLDFSQDKTGFFGDEGKRAVATQAAEDWAYFFDGTGLDQTPAGAETTLIWDPDGFNTSHQTNNGRAYTGYLLYAYGIDSPMLRSGGEPSHFGGFQSEGGKASPGPLPGGYEAGDGSAGTYNTGAGWSSRGTGRRRAVEGDKPRRRGERSLLDRPPRDRPRLGVQPGQRMTFGVAKLAGKLRDDRVSAYLGGDPKIDRADHLDGSIDPASLRGAFGNEYHGKTPFGRWLITRSDLLLCPGRRLQAPGDLGLLAPGRFGRSVASRGDRIGLLLVDIGRVEGGIPSYDWSVVEGALPEGLSLDPFMGVLHGTPKRSGDYEFTVRVRDQNERGLGVSRRLRLKVAAR